MKIRIIKNNRIYIPSLFFLFLLVISCASDAGGDLNKSDINPYDDDIKIISVTPSTQSSGPGKIYDSIVVRYNLMSFDSCELNIGFNVTSVSGFDILAAYKGTAAKGIHDYTFTNVNVEVKDWSPDNFKVYVNIGENATVYLAEDTMVLNVSK